MSDEAALVAAAKAGSVEAFTELVGSYRDGLLRYLVTRTPTYADAEDALQETLVNAFRYLDTFDARWRFSTWLYRIAINNARRTFRPAGEALDDVADEGRGPLAECIAADDRDNLWGSARRILSEEVFTALWLRYVQEMSVNDIAAAVGRSTAWTKVNLHRGRQRLEAEITGAGELKRKDAYG